MVTLFSVCFAFVMVGKISLITKLAGELVRIELPITNLQFAAVLLPAVLPDVLLLQKQNFLGHTFVSFVIFCGSKKNLNDNLDIISNYQLANYQFTICRCSASPEAEFHMTYFCGTLWTLWFINLSCKTKVDQSF